MIISSPKAVSLSIRLTETPQLQSEFVQIIQKQVADLLSTQLDGDFSVINFPSGFHWGIQYGPNNYYNQQSLNEIDSIIANTTSGGTLIWGGDSFNKLYNKILGFIAFSFSEEDCNTIRKEASDCAAQISSMINEWEIAVGPITEEQMKSAFPQTKQGYIEDQVQKRWDGDPTRIPTVLNNFKTAYQAYQVMAKKSNALIDSSYWGLERLKNAMTNTKTPSKDNGGWQTGENAYSLAYPGIPTQTAINSSLQTESNKVSASITISDFSSTTCNISINGSTKFNIPIGDFLSIGINGAASYDVSKYTTSSSLLKVTLTYPGITLIGSAPLNLSTDGKSGWYDNDIIQEAISNTGKDKTGFQLQSADYLKYFGKGNTFSRLKTLVICQQPTISITFMDSNVQMLTSDFKENLNIKIKLFDLFDIGSMSESYSVRKVEQHSTDKSVTITFGPIKPVGTTPSRDTTAYVLGGVAYYPPNDMSGIKLNESNKEKLQWTPVFPTDGYRPCIAREGSRTAFFSASGGRQDLQFGDQVRCQVVANVLKYELDSTNMRDLAIRDWLINAYYRTELCPYY